MDSFCETRRERGAAELSPEFRIKTKALSRVRYITIRAHTHTHTHSSVFSERGKLSLSLSAAAAFDRSLYVIRVRDVYVKAVIYMRARIRTFGYRMGE